MVKISRLFLLALLFCLPVLAGCKTKQVGPYAPAGNRQGGAMNGAPGGYGGYGGFPEGRITEEMRPGTNGEPMGGSYGGFGPANEGLDATGGAGGGSLHFDGHGGAYGGQGRTSAGMTPIYFDFDSSGIRADQVPAIERNAAFLNGNTSRPVLIEGNTDYRGTHEYNLALGERRAASAKNYLIELGVAAGRIRTISYGEERPLFLGDSESDYASNRRADFVLE